MVIDHILKEWLPLDEAAEFIGQDLQQAELAGYLTERGYLDRNGRPTQVAIDDGNYRMETGMSVETQTGKLREEITVLIRTEFLHESRREHMFYGITEWASRN